MKVHSANDGSSGVEQTIEITRLQKAGGGLTKVIALKDGRPVSDGSACWMPRGMMSRCRLSNLPDFANLIETLPSNEAIALGAMRADLPDSAPLRAKSDPLSKDPAFVTRTTDVIAYRPGRQALVLCDFDLKGMPASVREQFDKIGGFTEAIAFLCPEFKAAGYIRRLSTSAGLYNAETGERYQGSGGEHVYVLVADGADARRFLYALHDRAWLNGLGWHVVSKSGALLERSIVDRMVCAAERLVFEGNPVLVPPLKQDRREATVHDGPPLNTLLACPDLSAAEAQNLNQIKMTAALALDEARAKAHDDFVTAWVAKAVARGVNAKRARRTVEKWCTGVLLPTAALEFDDPAIGTKTAGDVLACPDQYIGLTLADPIEGLSYGRNCAIVLRRHDTGDVYIYSFAHGGANYTLRYDWDSITAAIDNADKSEVARLFCDLMTTGGVDGILDPVDEQLLVRMVAKLSGSGVRAVEKMLKEARQQKRNKRSEAKRQSRATDSKKKATLPAPFPDAEIGPEMAAWDSILSNVNALEPPMRDLSGWPVRVLEREPLGALHELTSISANDDEAELSRLPPPKQILLTPHDQFSVELEIGKHITFLKETKHGEVSVGPARRFIDHWLHFDVSRLPRVGAVLTMPLVLPDGTLLATNGLDRERQFVMRCDPKLLSFIPERAACDEVAVLKAFEFLVDEWLCDVAADLASKCVLLAYALSILERVLFPARPAFLVTAGQRASGKTTVLQMLVLAVLGLSPPAAAWARDEDERRKAILGYLMEGLPTIVWDNIRNGTVIASKVIEEICTAELHCDRLLGESKAITAAAYTINVFIGNNARAAGDLASRCLHARLSVDRPDPQNRSFTHVDPIQWTRDHRGEILRALYTILLGNPQLDPARAVEPKTRFKQWWSIVGAAIEHASDVYQGHHPSIASEPVDFSKMLDASDEEDEDAVEMREVLAILEGFWPNGAEFNAADVFERLGTRPDNDTPKLASLRRFFTPRVAATFSTKSVGRGLKAIVDRPLRVGESGVLTLKSRILHKQSVYRVERKIDGAADLFGKARYAA